MDKNVSSGTPYRTHPVFVDITGEKNLALLVSPSDIISRLKVKVIDEFALIFPNLEPLVITGLKVKRSGKFYRLSESMLVRDAFFGVKGNWFLYADVSTSNSNDQEVCSPKSFAKPVHDGDCPCNLEMCVSRSEKIEREADCARDFNDSFVVRLDAKQDLLGKTVQDNDEDELKAMTSKPTEDASINERQESPEPVMDKPLNVVSMVSGENVQEEKVCGYSVNKTKSDCNSDHGLSMEVQTYDEKTDFVKKKKMDKSKEAQLSIKNKAPKFEVILGGNVQESLVAEKVYNFRLNSTTEGIGELNHDEPVEGPKSDEKSAFENKRKRRRIAKDVSNGNKINMNEAVQENRPELHKVIMKESVQEKRGLSQKSISKESLLDKYCKDITEKNDAAVNHPNKTEGNWYMEKNNGNDLMINSQSPNNGPIHEELHLCLNNKKSKRKAKNITGLPNMNVKNKDTSLNTKFSPDNAEANQSTYFADQYTVVSVEENVKCGDDQKVISLSGRSDDNISEKTSHKTKKKKKIIDESETTLQKANENQISASKDQELANNQQAESTINLNSHSPINSQLLQDHMNDDREIKDLTKQHVMHKRKKIDVQCVNMHSDENDRNVKSYITSSPQKEGNQKKKKKKLILKSLLEDVRENSLNHHGNYLIKDPSSKELTFNSSAALPFPKKHLVYEALRGEGKGDLVAAGKEMDANGTIITEKEHTRQVQKADETEMPLTKPERSKGSPQSGSMMECFDQNVFVTSDGHNPEADLPENDTENGANILMKYYSKRKLRKHVATNKSTPRKTNPEDHKEPEVSNPCKNVDREPQKGESLSQKIIENGKQSNEILGESGDDSDTSNYSTSDCSEVENDEQGSPNGGVKKSAKAMMSGMSFRDVLRGSSSYKKAKKSTSHSFLEGLQSQPF